MEKSELLELLKESLEVRTELTLQPYCGPQLTTSVLFDGELLSETNTSVNTSHLKSDGLYY